MPSTPPVSPFAPAAARRRGAGPGAIVVLALVAFVALGLPEGALGVTFPALRETFGVPLSALGLLLLPYTGGYIVATLLHGRFVAPFGPARILVGAAATATVGALVFAGGPVFGVLLAGTLLLGASAGTVDAALNAYVSVHFEHRVLAFMHAGFGVGATIGPLAVTTLLQAGADWRVAYALLAGIQLALGLGWFLVRARFATTPARPADAEHPVVSLEGDFAEADLADPAARAAGSPRRSLLPLQMLCFFLYTGTEAATGFLIATLLTSRGLDTATAGLCTTAYWASLTLGRVLTGVVGPRLAPTRALGLSVIGAVVGLVAVWLGGTAAAAVGVVVVGFALAPFFPSLVSITPRRLGAERTVRVMGYQLAAASFGVAVVPALISVVADRTTPAAIAPALVAAGVALAIAQAVTSLVAGDLARSGRDAGPVAPMP